MQRSLVPMLLSVLTSAALLPAAPLHAQIKSLPQLGTPVPAQFLTSDKKEKRCRTSQTSEDPCTEIEIGKIRYTIAWDANTRAVTYLFTDDHRVVTDNGLAVGNSLRVIDGGHSDTTIPYMKWMIDPKWKDTGASLDRAVWYAALHQDYDHHFGDVVGFVQSRYIQLKP
ncbi:MAG TPA: hypothetical protein VGF88_11715 [Acidobacteriaceae bacterium]